ncbi:MAG: hypothetical protein LBD43_00900 [Holosporales bacterium]|jgi:phage tail sheath protein FI|nr:hypothetical protein [Holosporales bacterium]
MPNFLHVVAIQEIDAGTKVIKTAKSSVIGLIGTAPNATSAAFPLDTPVLVTGSKVPETLGNSGTLPGTINSIFTQIGAVLVVVRVESEETLVAGLDVFLASESTIHVKPQILIAPEFSGDEELLTAMIPVAEKLQAIIVADGTKKIVVGRVNKKYEDVKIEAFIYIPAAGLQNTNPARVELYGRNPRINETIPQSLSTFYTVSHYGTPVKSRTRDVLSAVFRSEPIDTPSVSYAFAM